MPGEPEVPPPPPVKQPPILGPPAIIPAPLPEMRVTCPAEMRRGETLTVHVDTNQPDSTFLCELMATTRTGRRVRLAGTTDPAGQAEISVPVPQDQADGMTYRLVVTFRQPSGAFLMAESSNITLTP